MNDPEPRNEEKEVLEKWRVWLDRPPRQSPQAAAAEIAAVLRARRGPHRMLWAVAATATAAVLIAGVLLQTRRPPELAPPVPAMMTVSENVSLQPDEVLIWIDEETPLYMHFQPPVSGGVP